jgi:hypothetical protein
MKMLPSFAARLQQGFELSTHLRILWTALVQEGCVFFGRTLPGGGEERR